jgi:hypothetical protein
LKKAELAPRPQAAETRLPTLNKPDGPLAHAQAFSVLFDQFRRAEFDQPSGSEDQYQQIVQLPEDRDEIRDEVKGRHEIEEQEPNQESKLSRSSRVAIEFPQEPKMPDKFRGYVEGLKTHAIFYTRTRCPFRRAHRPVLCFDAKSDRIDAFYRRCRVSFCLKAKNQPRGYYPPQKKTIAAVKRNRREFQKLPA